MARYLLDTNIASFLVKGVSTALQHRVRRVPRAQMAISSVTEAEMRFGLECLPAKAKLHRTVPKFLDSMESLSWDSQCAARYGRLAASQRRAGKPLGTLDTMIAAHALALGLILVTNDQGFRNVEGLTIEDWTKGPQRG